MGLERLHLLTTSGNCRLRIEWEYVYTEPVIWLSIEYWIFFIDDEAAYYTLHVSGYVPGDDGRALCVYKTAFFVCITCRPIYVFIHIHKVVRGLQGSGQRVWGALWNKNKRKGKTKGKFAYM